MNGISNLIGFLCIALLDIVSAAMLVRAIMSLFTDGNKVYNFVYSITEPIIMPVRKLLNKFDFSSGIPIDIPFLITYMLISVLRNILNIWF